MQKYISYFKKDLKQNGILCRDDLKSLNDYQKYLTRLNFDFFNLKKRPKKKRILSVELNYGHDVIRPSIYKYFSDLGYEVDFLLAEYEDNKRWNFFERFDHMTGKTVTGSYLFIDAVLSSGDIKHYDFVLLNTSIIFNEGHINACMSSLDSLYLNTKKIPQPKYGFLTIPPHPSLFNSEAEDSLIETKLLNGIPVLSHLGYRGLPILSPHYFGNVAVTQRSYKNKFLATGNILPHQKNHKLLLDTAEKLVEEGITDFEIIVNGGFGAINIPPKLESIIRMAGDNKPAELFKLIEECDFITALLDSTNEWHKNLYGHGTCSTAFMYSLGFAKPYIIEDFFLKSFDIDKSAVISYKHQDLYSAMKRAILMKSDEYNHIQSNILKEAEKRHDKSLSDIERLVKRQKG